MRKTPLLVFALITAFSCSKDGASLLTVPSTYHKTRIDLTAITRTFTNTGEVKTTEIVSRYDKMDSSWFTAQRNDLLTNRGKLDTIRTIDSKRMDIYDDYTYRSYTVAPKGKNMIVTAKDTTTGFIYEEVFSRSLNYDLALYKPVVFNEYLFTSTRGLYGFGYSTTKQFFLVQENDQFKAPWVIAVVHKVNGSIYAVQVQNKTDFNFYKRLNTGDTVSLREYAVSYDK